MKPRRGVSEIMATMVVLLIVSSLGVMLYNISASSLSAQQADLMSQVEAQKEAAMEKFEIIDVKSDSGFDYIYYLNYGTVTSNMSSVYLICENKLPGGVPRLFQMPIKEKIVINEHIFYLKIDSPSQSIIDNYNITYKIVSQRGISSEY